MTNIYISDFYFGVLVKSGAGVGLVIDYETLGGEHEGGQTDTVLQHTLHGVETVNDSQFKEVPVTV